MAKRSNRATRKMQRERAARAESRGLPQAPTAPRTAHASVSSMARRRAAARVQFTGSQASGAWLKVVIGLVLALAIVFVLSQSRKAQLLESKTSAKVLSEPTDSPKPQSPEEPAAPEVPTDALQSEASGTHEVDADGSESTPTQ